MFPLLGAAFLFLVAVEKGYSQDQPHQSTTSFVSPTSLAQPAEEPACPSEKVLNQAGARVKQLAEDVGKFAALEELEHERLDGQGHVARKETRSYEYVAAISEPTPGYLKVEEYRTENWSPAEYPDNIASSGFTMLAMVFHPEIQPTFEFACDGLGDWKGKPAWLVQFRQRDDRPNRIQHLRREGKETPIDLTGRAWISETSFQILHMESHLVRPLPNIQLWTERQIVDYGPVDFKKNKPLWLPSSAELYFDFRKNRYHRRHSFSRFRLFSTDTQETVTMPKEKPGS